MVDDKAEEQKAEKTKHGDNVDDDDSLRYVVDMIDVGRGGSVSATGDNVDDDDFLRDVVDVVDVGGGGSVSATTMSTTTTSFEMWLV